MSCRICSAPTREVLDLGESPPANWLKRAPDQDQASYPLVLEWCETCDNVQLRDTLSAEVLYRDYLYVTPDSAILEAHYATLLSYLLEHGYATPDSFVVEAGSNAGHFLRHISGSVGSILGVDPAERIAAEANAAGIPTISDFFSTRRAASIVAERGKADLIVARHCLAHNKTPHEMLDAAAALLADDGHLLIENAYVVNTIENGEFDQVYHEHMFYFSVRSMTALLALHGMRLVDVMMSEIHGGSIVFVAVPGADATVELIARHAAREELFLNAPAFARFAQRADQTKSELLTLVTELIGSGASVYTYGATAKGNTLLNYLGVTRSQIPFCVDSTPMKQGLFLPKSNIEIISEESAAQDPPDYYLLTAWNYQAEIIAKVRGAGNHSSKFIVPIPHLRVI
jgi:hypothetical protein